MIMQMEPKYGAQTELVPFFVFWWVWVGGQPVSVRSLVAVLVFDKEGNKNRRKEVYVRWESLLCLAFYFCAAFFFKKKEREKIEKKHGNCVSTQL